MDVVLHTVQISQIRLGGVRDTVGQTFQNWAKPFKIGEMNSKLATPSKNG